MARCASVHPEDPDRSCLVAGGVHADHMDSQGTWPNPEVTERIEVRQRQSVRRSKANKGHLRKIAAEGIRGRREFLETERRARGIQVGIPPEAVGKWAKDVWLAYAEEVFVEFLSIRTEPFTTAEDVWPLLYAPEEMRAMSLVTQRMVRQGRMREVGAKRLRGVYRTRDGVEFAENKLVPLYQPT